jgi:hypothetical protein
MPDHCLSPMRSPFMAKLVVLHLPRQCFMRTSTKAQTPTTLHMQSADLREERKNGPC